MLLLVGAAAAAVLVVGIAARGIAFLGAVRDFLEFYTGPFALVSLSLSVMVGLAATDRLLATIRIRILLQIAHRVITQFGLVFLAAHVILKISAGKAAFANAFWPFSSDRVAVNLGTVTALTWLAVALTGVFRARFATRGQPWMWRLAHSMAYLCWPVAVVHGLTAGRAAPAWVAFSYSACLGLVGLGLLVRFLVTLRTRPGPDGRVVPMPLGRGTAAQNTGLLQGMTADGALDAEFWASLRREVRRRTRGEVRARNEVRR